MGVPYFQYFHCVSENINHGAEEQLRFFPTQLCVQGSCIFRENCRDDQVPLHPKSVFLLQNAEVLPKMKEYLYSLRVSE